MPFQFHKANVVRALLIVLGAMLGYAVKMGHIPQEIAADLSLAAGTLFGAGVVQVNTKGAT